MELRIRLKSGERIEMQNFKHINYTNSIGDTVTVKEFEEFYLYDTLVTFVGENDIITLNSNAIEYVEFKKQSD